MTGGLWSRVLELLRALSRAHGVNSRVVLWEGEVKEDVGRTLTREDNLSKEGKI